MKLYITIYISYTRISLKTIIDTHSRCLLGGMRLLYILKIAVLKFLKERLPSALVENFSTAVLLVFCYKDFGYMQTLMHNKKGLSKRCFSMVHDRPHQLREIMT